MIADDRRVLAEMHRRLQETDPAFVARMSVPQQRPFPTLTVIGVLTYIVAPLISFLFGATMLVLTLAAALGAAAVVVVRRRRARIGIRD